MSDLEDANEGEKLLGIPSKETLQVELTASGPETSLFRAELCLYSSHFLSTWGQRSHEFFIGLALFDLAGASFTLVSAFGLVDGLAIALAAPAVGQWVDRTERLKAACGMYIVQNVGIALSAATVTAAYAFKMTALVQYGLVIITTLVASASSVGALGASMSVEREWTKALHPSDSAKLARLNAGMRRIDLTCLILSPIMVGLLMTYVGNAWAAMAILAWNLLSWTPEWLLLRYAQSMSLSLRQQTIATMQCRKPFTLTGWGLYFRQTIWPATFALALLYLTVLSFGLLSTAYLNWRGLPEATLSIYRGFGALAGVLATFAFPILQQRLGLPRAGAAGILLQVLALTVAVLPAALGRITSLPTSDDVVTHALVGGIIVSRFGLWLFDLCVSQIMQEAIPAHELGTISGVQGSLSNLFQSLSFLAGLVVPRPEDFVWLMLGSWAMVSLACSSYMSWACAARQITSDESNVSSCEVES